MLKKGMNRRQFLQTSGLTAVGVAAAGSGVALIDPRGAWALQLSGTLDQHTAETLLVMTRRLYPHDTLADMYYAVVVEDLDLEAKADPEVATLLTTGVQELDAATGIAWRELSEGYQLEVLTAMEDSAFFQKVRGTTVVSLYNNPLVWRHFGYEGPAFDLGGYVHRGFNDLSWLPEPSAEASPALAS